MLRISKKVDYAIRVVMALAMKDREEWVSATSIQEETQIPVSFSRRIIANLSQLALIESIPGPNGGIRLARPADQISLLDVLEGLEGDIMVMDCICEEKACAFSSDCVVRPHLDRIQRILSDELRKIDFLQLAKESIESYDLITRLGLSQS